MSFELVPFTELLSIIVDNRGRTCPVGDTGIPLIATNCIDSSSLYPRYDTTRYVSDETYRSWFRGHPMPGDILFVCKGSPGRTNWVPDPVDFCIAQDMVSVRANPEKIYSKYLFAALRSSVVQTQIDNMHVGTMIPHFKKGDFSKLNIPVPSRDAQRVIGDFYFTLSERIALLRETNATLEAMAQALFKSWFVDFDPVHANAGTSAATLPAELQALFPSTFTDTPQGLVPEGWKIGTIADFADLNPESWTAKKHPETVAYIDLANAKDNVIADIAEFKFDAAPSRARRVLRDGDTVVGTVRPGNRSFAFIQDAAINLTGSTGFAVLRPKHPRNTAFVYLAATNDSSIDYLTHIADGGAYPAVRPEVVANLSCVCPPLAVLEAFDSVAAELLTKVSKNHQQAQTLATLCDTLLPRLISGQLRLPDAEAALAEAGA
ncbi:restriction endonuclease subunit S [Vogesella indigofera]|uniref:restriction endonuclease subunit S n=1 Tax=Vogesella indigofera TaxID=45465 RepID=UPI00234ED540|nr:restriction endonuclease subunit S [Vogesella indigofera]MDC7698333.1 restriction endonuclease subunit S [Vogesella indigofera]